MGIPCWSVLSNQDGKWRLDTGGMCDRQPWESHVGFFVARARCLSAGLRYLRLTRLPRHDRGPVPGGNRSAASCLCTVLRRALYHYATRSPVGIPRWRLVLIGISFATVQGASLQYGCFCFLMSQLRTPKVASRLVHQGGSFAR